MVQTSAGHLEQPEDESLERPLAQGRDRVPMGLGGAANPRFATRTVGRLR